MIQVRVRFFAGHRDIVGQPEITRALEPGATMASLWEQLATDYPPLQGYTGRLIYAVNQEFSDSSTLLQDGDEVAFIPPVSGGTAAGGTHAPDPHVEPFHITSASLEAAPLVDYVQSPEDGAVVTFAGIVRNHFGGRATAYLTYEAYPEMAIPVLAQLAAESQSRWSVGRIAIHHRIGRLEIGETAVLIVVAAPHRQAAFQAAGYIMDRIKEVVPIWKQEHWADGASEWHE